MSTFTPFGPDHLGVLSLTGASALTLITSARALRRRSEDRVIRMSLAAGLVANELSGWVAALARGQFTLPLHLCDLAVFLMAWAMLARHRLVGELAFCWGLGGSLQAILTPDLHHGFPSYPWLQFFLGHVGLVLSAVYLASSGRVRLRSASVWRVWAITNVYVVVIGLVNWRLGTNFGYLAAKPSQPSVLDYLGPWPYYLIGMEAIGLALFFACFGVNRAVERLAGPSSSVVAP